VKEAIGVAQNRPLWRLMCDVYVWRYARRSPSGRVHATKEEEDKDRYL